MGFNQKTNFFRGRDNSSQKPLFLATLLVLLLASAFLMIIQSSENDLDAEDSQSDILPEYGADVYYVTFKVESKVYQVAGINGTNTKQTFATVMAGSQLTVSGNSITCVTNSYPTNKTFKADVQSNCKYQFDHWEISPSTTVNSDTTCTAIYSVKQVTITFKSNNTSMGTVDRSSLTLNYGSSCSSDAWSGKLEIIDGETNAKTYVTPTAKSGYEFSSWSGVTTSITSSKTFTAYFKAPTVYYTVYFASNNSDYGSVSRSSLTVEEGTYFSTNGSKLSIDGYTITATEKTDTAQYDYSFGSWSSSSGYINGSRTIYANFNRTLQQYTVSFGTNDSSWGTVSPGSVTVAYGSSITASSNVLTIGGNTVTATPAADTYLYLYDFGSWSTFPSTVTGATSITANFIQTLNQVTISFTVNDPTWGTISQSSIIAYGGDSISSSGGVITIGSNTVTATPTQSNVQYTYTFGSWSTSSGTVTGPMTITATFDRTVNQYTVSILPAKATYGHVSDTRVVVDYGTSISSNGTTLTIGSNNTTFTPSTGCTFNSWKMLDGSTLTASVTGDMTIVAHVTISTVTVTFYGGAGGSPNDLFVMATMQIPYGTTPMVFTPNLSDGVFDGWYTDSSLTNLFDTSSTLTSNQNLYCGATSLMKFTSQPVAYGSLTSNESLGMMIFDATGSESAYRVKWDFGDGTTSTDKVSYHLYSEPGKYDVSLTAYNYYGDTDVKEYQVVITEGGARTSDNTTLYILGGSLAAIISLFLIARVV